MPSDRCNYCGDKNCPHAKDLKETCDLFLRDLQQDYETLSEPDFNLDSPFQETE